MIYMMGIKGLRFDDVLANVTKYKVDYVVDIRINSAHNGYFFTEMNMKPAFKKLEVKYIASGKYFSKRAINTISKATRENAIKRLKAVGEKFNVLIIDVNIKYFNSHRHKVIARSIVDLGGEVIHLYGGRKVKARFENIESGNLFR